LTHIEERRPPAYAVKKKLFILSDFHLLPILFDGKSDYVIVMTSKVREIFFSSDGRRRWTITFAVAIVALIFFNALHGGLVQQCVSYRQVEFRSEGTNLRDKGTIFPFLAVGVCTRPRVARRAASQFGDPSALD
jgi:hypothetical protein